jgi:hypothetical protein
MNTSFLALTALTLLAAPPLPAGAPPAPPADLLASYAWLPGPAVAGPNGRLGFVDQSLSLAAPLWADEQVGNLTANAGVKSDLLQAPSSPLQVWDLSLGLAASRRFDGGWSAGGDVKVGSAGDRPFEAPGTLKAAVNAFLRLPSGDRDAWTLSLSYAPLAPAPLPKPALSYSWNPCEGFSADLGVPFPLVVSPARPGDGRERLDLGSGPLLTGQFRLRW